MTDEHGGEESQATHEEAGHEHTGPEAGTWSDDHPPVDDFADSGAGEEGATVSQESTHEGDETVAVGSGQSRSKMALLAGIGGIMVLLSVVYWQFSHPAPPPPMTLPPPAPKSSSTAASTASAKPPEPAHTGSIEETDINALYKSSTESIPPVATETSPTTAMATVQTSPAIPVPTPSAPPSQPAVTTAPTPVMPTPPVPDTRIDALNTRIEDLQKSLEQANRQLNQLSNVVAANQAMPPVSNQNNPALEDRLGKIEQSLMQIEHNQTAKAQAQSPSSSNVMEEETAPAPAKATSRHAKTKKKPVHKKIKVVQHKSAAPVATGIMMPPPSQTIPWILRAATPTEAWVAADARTPELRHVQVGDTLSGVGQVRAIRQTKSGWEIEGTTGSIR